MRILLATLAALAVSTVAHADISGFVTGGTGDLSGQVTTLDGKPMETTVHVVTNAARELLLETDKRGNYSTKLTGGDVAYVFVEAKAKISGQTVASVKEGGEEAIAIREAVPPSVPAKPKSRQNVVLEYSKTADDANKWTRAWLLLHVSDKGEVVRVKLINKPGLDLDAIAVREAFKLSFEPARDRTKKAIASMVLWTYEWPASWWLAADLRVEGELPDSVAFIQCAAKPPSRSQRDCSGPNIANAIRSPWMEKPTK
jgi:hypothetical protein